MKAKKILISFFYKNRNLKITSLKCLSKTEGPNYLIVKIFYDVLVDCLLTVSAAVLVSICTSISTKAAKETPLITNTDYV